MGKGKELNAFEKSEIQALFAEKKTISYIAAKIRRSRTVVANYLKKSDDYGLTPRSGCPPVISARQIAAILKAVKNKSITASKIKEMFGLRVSNNTILRILKNKCSFSLRKMNQSLFLTTTIWRIECVGLNATWTWVKDGNTPSFLMKRNLI
ncbi:hypothetical protein ENBRE01_0082 [Enteropsectra breve]|nr:hypothetical protein ENBRE01_0082 [Enteropsectra breve]